MDIWEDECWGSSAEMKNRLQLLPKGKKTENSSGCIDHRGPIGHVEHTILPPYWLCHDCAGDLTPGSVNASAGKGVGESSRSGLQDFIHGGIESPFAGIGPVDDSFVVVPVTKHNQKPGYAFPTRRSRAGKIPHGKALGNITSSQAKHLLSLSPAPFRTSRIPGPIGHESHRIRALDESFVVLPSSAASLYGPAAVGTAVNPRITQQTNAASFYSHVKVMEKCSEIASTGKRVEQMLCLECIEILTEGVEKAVEEANDDIVAYETCLSTLQIQKYEALNEADFAQEKLEIEEEERMLETQIEEAEKQHKELQLQLLDLELEYQESEELEERFWQEFNGFQLQFISNKEEEEAVSAKLDVASVQLESLRQKNVLDDVFHIRVDGDFGTINNFRLPKVPVEWDEINAAWGQACFLLYTLALYCDRELLYRILPSGSYARIADNKNAYELFGPVNLYRSTRYDKAMTLFLACLKELADFASANDRAANMPRAKWFKLPHKIETSKVGGLQYAQSLNDQKTWTKALKNTLHNLWELQAWVANSPFYRDQALLNQKFQNTEHFGGWF